MNKTELTAAIAEQAGISKKDAEKALKAFTDVVADELKKGEKVQLVGFGTFEVVERAEILRTVSPCPLRLPRLLSLRLAKL